MKYSFLLLFSFLFIGHYAVSQTNVVGTTGNVGIGTLSPAEKLEIAGDITPAILFKSNWDVLGTVGAIKFNMAGTDVGGIELDRDVAVGRQSSMKFSVKAGSNLLECMRISNLGYVGIGTISPTQKLDVAGYIQSAPSADAGGVYFGNTNHGVRRLTGTNDVELFTTSGSLFFSVTGNQMVLRGNGDVEMGAPNISSKLTVNGKITATKVKVTQNVWADFVFEPTYVLPSLYDLESYIKQHKHLPEIPSAKEVKEQGLDLGDNQAKLLQKIEELTLYIIEQQKQLEAQKKMIMEINGKLNKK